MILKRLFGIVFISLAAGSLVVVQGSSNPMNNISQNASTDTSERAIFQTLIAGLKAREALIASASAYLVNERYYNESVDLQRAYQGYAAEDPNMKTWAQILKGPPKFLVKFWGTDGVKIREDEKPLVQEPGGYTEAVFDGTQLQVSFVGSNIVQQGELGSWPINSSARVLQLSFGANAPHFSEWIENAHSHFVGKEVIGGLETYKVESLPSSSGTVETWWIAPSRGYVVVKNESRSKEVTGNGPVTSWRLVNVIDKLANPDKGLWIPVERRSVKYVTVETKEVWESVVRNSLLSFQINKPLPAQMFALLLPPGSKVGRSEMEGGPYTIQGDKKQFESALQKAKIDGEQPDLETLDIRDFEAKLHTGKPNTQDLSDDPAGGKIETVQILSSPLRLPLAAEGANVNR